MTAPVPDVSCRHLCPECRDGKCRNCDGAAWCDYSDEPTECDCTHGGAA